MSDAPSPPDPTLEYRAPPPHHTSQTNNLLLCGTITGILQGINLALWNWTSEFHFRWRDVATDWQLSDGRNFLNHAWNILYLTYGGPIVGLLFGLSCLIALIWRSPATRILMRFTAVAWIVVTCVNLIEATWYNAYPPPPDHTAAFQFVLVSCDNLFSGLQTIAAPICLLLSARAGSRPASSPSLQTLFIFLVLIACVCPVMAMSLEHSVWWNATGYAWQHREWSKVSEGRIAAILYSALQVLICCALLLGSLILLLTKGRSGRRPLLLIAITFAVNESWFALHDVLFILLRFDARSDSALATAKWLIRDAANLSIALAIPSIILVLWRQRRAHHPA